MSNFDPCVWIVTEREIPESILSVAIWGEDHFRLIGLPKGVTELPPLLEVKLVGLIARSHYRKSHGEVRFFGRVLRYLYLRTEQERWVFNIQGHLVNRHGEPIRRGQYTLSLKKQPHRDIGLLFRRHIGKHLDKTPE
jgi:hypothetical protein